MNKTGEYKVIPAIDHKAAAQKLEKLVSEQSQDKADEIIKSLPNLSESKTSFVKHMNKQRQLVSQ